MTSNIAKYFLPHSSTVIFSLKSGRNGNASHSHSFQRIMLIFSPVVQLIPWETPCEFQSDRTTLDFWPKSCRTAQRLDSGQLEWVLGRLGCVLGPLGWVLGRLGWVLGPLGWVLGRLGLVQNPAAQLDAWSLAKQLIWL